MWFEYESDNSTFGHSKLDRCNILMFGQIIDVWDTEFDKLKYGYRDPTETEIQEFSATITDYVAGKTPFVTENSHNYQRWTQLPTGSLKPSLVARILLSFGS
jgi:hypothetical protein